ncbi:MAG: HAD hydrolase family protein [Pirellulaceae bacterium]
MSFRTTAPYDLVICDIDGCLSPEDTSPMDVPNLERIAEHNRLAVGRRDRPLVTLCSGRPIAFVEAMTRLIQNDVLPAIGENGVWLFDPAANWFEMDPAITPEHLEMVHEASRYLSQRYAGEGVRLQPGKSAAVSLWHPQTEHLRSICPAIREEFARRDWPLRVSMTWYYINCDLQFIDKASGIRRLLEKTGVDVARTAGIGDTTSDRAIAETVAHFTCPANAAEEVKAWAHYVSPQAEAAGVADILTRLAE